MSDSASIERYYRFHAGIYDATRWSFLFGRSVLIEKIARHLMTAAHILEVGCGTGKNLIRLCRYFPTAEITALDISAAMLKRARKNLGTYTNRIELLHRAYDHPLATEHPFDLILFSYSLSMINPDWLPVIDYAYQDLEVGGLIAVVDFHDSTLPQFKSWMRLNHVRMDGHLLPALQSRFRPVILEVHRAYGGLWSYFIFLGTA